jgi:hypothetical protein
MPHLVLVCQIFSAKDLLRVGEEGTQGSNLRANPWR